MVYQAADVLAMVKTLKETGTNNVAFDRAYEFLVQRKKQFSLQLEELVILFLDLAVEFRDSRRIKEVLQQFKTSCFSASLDSLVSVSKHLIERVEAACAKVAEATRGGGAVADGIADPMDESVEASILRAVSGDLTRDRTERTVLQPWLRFAWDCYSIVIRTIRTLPILERQLQEAVMQPALEFCRKYRRPGDFRRLSSEIENAQRKLLDEPGKPQGYNGVEVGEALLRTRFLQLDVATAMDLWMDVERVVDSLQDLITRRRPTASAGKAASQSARRAFYAKLADVFWLAQNKLFHAIALLSHTVTQVSGTTDAAVKAEACSASVLAVVCVPFWQPSCAAGRGLAALDSSMQREREIAQRLSRLLMRSTVQSRSTLMHDLMTRGFLENAAPEAVAIYKAIESVGVEASPLTAAHDVATAAKGLFARMPSLRRYEAALSDVAAVRVLQHVSGIFRTVSIDYLLSLLPQYTHTHQLEELLCEIVSNNVISLQCSIQQDTQTVEFRQRDQRLDSLAAALPTCALRMLEVQALLPPTSESAAEQPTLSLTPARIALYSRAKEDAEHKTALLRKSRIAEQRTAREKRLEERNRELQEHKELELSKRREEEDARHHKENQERERKREEEKQAANLAEHNEMLLTAAATTYGLSDKLKDLEKGLRSGRVKETTEVATKIQDALVKQQAEHERKRQEERTRADHFIRECRRDEQPLLREWITQRTTLSDAQRETRLKEHHDQWEKDKAAKTTFAPLQPVVAEYIRLVMDRRARGH